MSVWRTLLHGERFNSKKLGYVKRKKTTGKRNLAKWELRGERRTIFGMDQMNDLPQKLRIH